MSCCRCCSPTERRSADESHRCCCACPLARVRRWRDEGTLLRAYRSHDGAITLADPILGGNAACEPATTVTWQARKPATSQDQSPPDNS